MTLPVKFERGLQPSLELGRHASWGGMSATMARASPGLHRAPAAINNRVLFYTGGPGEAECATEGLRQRRLQRPGDFDVIPVGAEASWEDVGPSEMLSLQLTPALVAATAESLALPPARTQITPRLGARDARLEHLLRTIIVELESPSPAGRLFMDAVGTALTIRLLQNFSKVTTGPGGQRLSKPQLRRICDYVETHLDADLSLAEISGVAGLSIAHLTSLFRRTTGDTVHGYVMGQRIRRAKHLLLKGNTPIAEVALQTGFAHQSHLASWMKRRLGLTPASLRRQVGLKPAVNDKASQPDPKTADGAI